MQEVLTNGSDRILNGTFPGLMGVGAQPQMGGYPMQQQVKTL